MAQVTESLATHLGDCNYVPRALLQLWPDPGLAALSIWGLISSLLLFPFFS